MIIIRFFVLFAVLGCFNFILAQEIVMETRPRAISIPDPEYPKEAMESKFGGDVLVQVAIDKNGNVSGVEDALGPNAPCISLRDPRVEAIRTSAVKAAKLAKFQPALRSGKPVPSFTILKYEFVPRAPHSQAPLDRTSLKLIKSGVINGKAISLPRPLYPSKARPTRAQGVVTVNVLIGEDGNVLLAGAVKGHPLLRGVAVEAACAAKFSPTLLQGEPVKVSGVITYNFMP